VSGIRDDSRRPARALFAHCGGEEAISTPRRILVDLPAAAAVLRRLTLVRWRADPEDGSGR
jgi:hypothetical protein